MNKVTRRTVQSMLQFAFTPLVRVTDTGVESPFRAVTKW